jgi:hypothetical protein
MDCFVEFGCDEFTLDESHRWPRPKKGETGHRPMSKLIATLKMAGNCTRTVGDL